MVEVLGTGDNSLPNNVIQEARSFLATLVSALATLGNELYTWFLSIANRFLTFFESHPIEGLKLVSCERYLYGVLRYLWGRLRLNRETAHQHVKQA